MVTNLNLDPLSGTSVYQSTDTFRVPSVLGTYLLPLVDYYVFRYPKMCTLWCSLARSNYSSPPLPSSTDRTIPPTLPLESHPVSYLFVYPGVNIAQNVNDADVKRNLGYCREN